MLDFAVQCEQLADRETRYETHENLCCGRSFNVHGQLAGAATQFSAKVRQVAYNLPLSPSAVLR